MDRLPLDTEDLLRAFLATKDGVLSTTDLKALLPDGDVRGYRIGQPNDAGFIAPCAWEECRYYDVVIDTGAPTAFRITVKGRDYLAMQDQERKQHAKKNRIKKQNEARADKKEAQNLCYQRNTAIIVAVISGFITIVALLIQLHN